MNAFNLVASATVQITRKIVASIAFVLLSCEKNTDSDTVKDGPKIDPTCSPVKAATKLFERLTFIIKGLKVK
jgi:hypothetical protein